LFPILVGGDEAIRRLGDKVGLRDKLQAYLAENRVGTVIHYPIAPHRQECYANEVWNTSQLSLPITEILADCELSLPISPTMTIEDTAEVVRLINECQGE
jgi:dTDP-4-amino-4,6-dideoxygalactose transaminase